MTVDDTTIKLAGSFVTVASGLFLMTHWFQDRSAWPAFWWALANILSGVGIAVMAAHDMMPGPLWHVTAPLLITGLGTALMGVATWVFNDGAVDPRVVAAAIVLWFGLSVWATAFGYDGVGIALGPGLSGGLFVAAAAKFWSARREALRGRMPMIAVLCLQAFALVLLVVGLASLDRPDVTAAPLGVFGAMAFVQLVYAGGSAVFLITMLKERTEAEHKAASLTDPLTGLPNRRAFMERAQRYIDRCHHDRTPISLLAFDLDKFKTINDRFGHPFGDHVLQVFGDVLSRVVRPTDQIARIGGEEFLLLLPGCGSRPAVAVADRVRLAFEADAVRLRGQVLNATVSAGAATAVDGCRLPDLIAAADDALYRAKALGRNCVVLASGADELDRGTERRRTGTGPSR